MVAILTLFVGLVTGAQSVALEVAGPVVRVEVRLNDRLIGRASAEPWVSRCDFGSELHPGRLQAIGFDAEGREVTRDTQWINLPDRRAEAVIVPELDENSRVIAAKVMWSSPELNEPESVSAEVDGTTVNVREDGSLSLVDFSSDEVHVLTVAVEFSREVILRKELVFGTGFSGELNFDLTAVPIVLDPGLPLPEESGFADVFFKNEMSLETVALEKGPGRLVVVRDQAVEEFLERFERKRKNYRRRHREEFENGPPDSLGDDISLRVMAPVTVQPEGDGRPALLFPISADVNTGRKGLLKIVRASRYPKRAFGLRRFADAVAVAGMRAATGNRRRAVLLILGPNTTDASMHSVSSVRGYLESLRVPLHVWQLGRNLEADADMTWGAPDRIVSYGDFISATRRLKEELERQAVIWLRGSHLPQEVKLKPQTKGFQLVE